MPKGPDGLFSVGTGLILLIHSHQTLSDLDLAPPHLPPVMGKEARGTFLNNERLSFQSAPCEALGLLLTTETHGGEAWQREHRRQRGLPEGGHGWGQGLVEGQEKVSKDFLSSARCFEFPLWHLSQRPLHLGDTGST